MMNYQETLRLNNKKNLLNTKENEKREKVRKLIISYRCEDNSYKKKFISVAPDKFREFNVFQGSSGRDNNHKILKELKFV